MIRRSTARLLLLATAVAALSGCATFQNADLVARVGDAEIEHDEFAAYADEFFAPANPLGAPPAQDGRVDGEVARGLVGLLVRQEALRDFLAEHDVDPSAIQQEYFDANATDPTFSQFSSQLKQLAADVNPDVTTQVLAAVEPPTADELRTSYATNPASTGMLCLRHILVATEAEAESVLDELAAGAEFATLAEERSTDPTAQGTGGALTGGPENACIPLTTMQQSFDRDFTEAALAAREGVPTQPVQSSFGWHVIVHRPWDEIADSIAELHQPGDSGGYLFDGYLATADIHVDPRYGRWNPVTASVEAVG